MSDKELPEQEGGAIPLVIVGLGGLLALFFVGVVAWVLLDKPPLEDPPETEFPTDEEERGVKVPARLLGPEETFRVRFETTAGPFTVQVNPEWAPGGATQFRELVEAGFFDENRFFRVMPRFIVQFGINGDPEENAKWRKPIADDPVNHSNTRGTITFAMRGMSNTRTTQVFINLEDNTSKLDNQGFAPFGEVVEGMENVEKINPEYEELPDQSRIQSEGNAYLIRNFPRLDYIKSARIVE